jgi:hypothetical protein
MCVCGIRRRSVFLLFADSVRSTILYLLLLLLWLRLLLLLLLAS